MRIRSTGKPTTGPPTPVLRGLSILAFALALALCAIILPMLWLCLLPPSPQAPQVAHATILDTPTPVCNLSWHAVSSPSPGSPTNYLFAVTAVSANDVWASGLYYDGNSARTLTIHWDGSQWTQVPSPNATAQSNLLLYIKALATDNVWAVGYATTPTSTELTLIEHWDGTQWTIVPSPNPFPRGNRLYAISAVSSSDIWAVGYFVNINNANSYDTLTEHWDGVQWSIVPSPNLHAQANQLRGVAALTSDDVWAAGLYGYSHTLLLHWDGVQWRVVPTADPPGSNDNWFNAVLGIASNDVWFVGSYAVGTGPNSTYVVHWNGIQLSTVPSPNLGPSTNDLYDIASVSPDDIWAVGYYCCNSGGPSLTLAMHWDGVQWSIVNTPNPGVYNNDFMGVAAISSSDIWAVGRKQCCHESAPKVGQRFLTCHRYGGCLGPAIESNLVFPML